MWWNDGGEVLATAVHNTDSPSYAPEQITGFTMTQFPWVAIGGLTLAATGIWGVYGPFWGHTNETATSNSQAVVRAPIINMFGNVAGFVGPYLVGVVKVYRRESSKF